MADERVVPGEELVTSGGDRIFPKGLPGGQSGGCHTRQGPFPQHSRPTRGRLDRLEEVLVVTKVTEQPPDVKDLGPIRASDILAQRLPTVPGQTTVDAGGNAVVTPELLAHALLERNLALQRRRRTRQRQELRLRAQLGRALLPIVPAHRQLQDRRPLARAAQQPAQHPIPRLRRIPFPAQMGRAGEETRTGRNHSSAGSWRNFFDHTNAISERER